MSHRAVETMEGRSDHLLCLESTSIIENVIGETFLFFASPWFFFGGKVDTQSRWVPYRNPGGSHLDSCVSYAAECWSASQRLLTTATPQRSQTAATQIGNRRCQ